MKTQILGTFEPTRYDESTIEKEFSAWLYHHGVLWESTSREPLIIRTPTMVQQLSTDPVITDWHRDNAGPRGRYLKPNIAGLHLIVWTNVNPTEIRYEEANGSYTELNFEIKPFDVVVINNDECVHRTPANLDNNRWFLRIIRDPSVVNIGGRFSAH